MIAEIQLFNKKYQVDFFKPLDISIPYESGKGVKAWYVDDVKIEPVKMGDWVGEVSAGASVNFRNIYFNPHGHGTHTECVGHITKESLSVNRSLGKYFFSAILISVTPEKIGNDEIITLAQVQQFSYPEAFEALIIRTLPNELSKLNKNYSNTNPPYLAAEVAEFLHAKHVQHLLIDMPSVDREKDDGKLAMHHAFWQYPPLAQLHKTITEMIFVSNEIADGRYLLELQTAPFVNDATPSRPILYRLMEM
jgi:kynurenine formamidase